MIQDASALSNILTQEEIDALLTPAVEEKKASTFELVKNAPPAQHYPLFEKKLDALCRYLAMTIKKITSSDNIQASVQSFITGQLGAYLDTLPKPSIIGYYRLNKYKQSCLMSVSTSLAYCLVDMALGGRRGTSAIQIENRNYTKIEQTILQKILNEISPDLTQSFEEQFTFEAIDINPKTAFIASPCCDVLIARLDVTIEKSKGVIDIVLPSHLLSQLDLDNLPTLQASDAFAQDLATSLMRVGLELKAVLDEKQLSFKAVCRWKKGDILPLTYSEDKPIILQANGQRLFKGALKVHQKNISIELTKKIFEEM